MIKLSKQALNVINLSLLLITTLLFFNLFGFHVPNIGFAIQDFIDPNEAICFSSWQDQTSEIELNACCNEIKKQLSCNKQLNIFNSVRTDITCSTGQSTISYSLTSKAHRYCIANFS